MNRRTLLQSLLAFSALGGASYLGRFAKAEEAGGSSVDRAKLDAMVQKGIAFLRGKGQSTDGTFSKQIGIGVTAMAADAMMRHGNSPDEPAVAKALKVVASSAREDGGIYAVEGRIKTYETCIAMQCLKTANRRGAYDAILKGADKFLREVPWDGPEGYKSDSEYFGGAGYGVAAKPGGRGRPDLSNTAYLIEALRSSGASADDETIKNALIFVSRCQNLESEHNTTPFASKINDGGFYYTPVAGGNSDEPMEAGGLRSYGSMSYSGLKSMVFAGLKEDDPRVKAVVAWLGKHYDVSSNPGMGDGGLFYYYLTFAKGLDAYGKDFIIDEKGTKHDWRKDLVEELAKRQKEDGSWTNANAKWMEGDPNVCTTFALLALSYCKPVAKPQ